MNILIATSNPAKINGAINALKHYFKNFDIVGVSVPSDVPEQPINEEVLQGARNRADNLICYAKQNKIYADLFLSTEGGLSNQLGSWCNFNIAVVKDNKGNESVGVSSGFPIPESYIENIKGTSLGDFMDNLFNEDKSATKCGGIRYLTKGAVTRGDLIEQAFTLALIQFVNDNWNDFER